MKRERIWCVDVAAESSASLLEIVEQSIASGKIGMTLFCANPHSLVVARNDVEFLEDLRNADVLVPDGQGIVVASKMLGGTITKRITGYDIFTGIAERWNRTNGRSFFFLGSTERVLEKIRARMQKEFPCIAVSGMYPPPFHDEFSEEEDRRMIDVINDAHPTALWVGMTAPKQEKWIMRNRTRLRVPLIGAIGAVFDFFAGTKQRSSPAMQDLGLEWLPRLIHEPRRLWRRNIISTPIFLSYVMKQRLGL
jgi:N-acetylglucosaminyldiphosphoundecaprenol N-acetyl-beta-D-mannosaminyltransferase